MAVRLRFTIVLLLLLSTVDLNFEEMCVKFSSVVKVVGEMFRGNQLSGAYHVLLHFCNTFLFYSNV